MTAILSAILAMPLLSVQTQKQITTLIQEKLEGGLYLESGVRIGAGNMFYPLRDNDIQKSMRSLDTVYILQADLGQVTA